MVKPPEPPPVAKVEPARSVDARRDSAGIDVDDLPSAPSGGKTPTVTPSKKGSTKAMMGSYVGSRKSDKFHVPGCRNAKKILEENLIQFKTREEAAQGRMPARDCNP
ncbi:hypothetical protein D7V88_41205 [Corallococcus terminator]|uniref:Ada DNA repair metal-binding domain-containing protein n=1 Tax=Corallococcus terminator TaxID=2316733 RepID=A0A3A8HMW3_9BACT|nr:hypothetical protein D7V88_41205 [Corallococcus terminator]